MFQKGEYVIHGNNGACFIEDVSHLDIPGSDRNRLYYVLQPLGTRESKIYSPVDNNKVYIRKILTRKEAEALMEEIPDIEQIWIPNEKLREEKYREVMKACDCRQWIGMMKTLYFKRRQRMAQGRKFTAVDERYLREAEERLYGELSLSFGLERREMEQKIIGCFQKAEEQRYLRHAGE